MKLLIVICLFCYFIISITPKIINKSFCSSQHVTRIKNFLIQTFSKFFKEGTKNLVLSIITKRTLIMMLLRARDNNIQSFAYIWLHKRNQNEFLKHPKIKWLDRELEPPTSGLPVHYCPPSNHLIFGCLRNSF